MRNFTKPDHEAIKKVKKYVRSWILSPGVHWDGSIHIPKDEKRLHIQLFFIWLLCEVDWRYNRMWIEHALMHAGYEAQEDLGKRNYIIWKKQK